MRIMSKNRKSATKCGIQERNKIGDNSDEGKKREFFDFFVL